MAVIVDRNSTSCEMIEPLCVNLGTIMITVHIVLSEVGCVTEIRLLKPNSDPLLVPEGLRVAIGRYFLKSNI